MRSNRRCNCTFPVLVAILVTGLVFGAFALLLANSVSEVHSVQSAPATLPTLSPEDRWHQQEGTPVPSDRLEIVLLVAAPAEDPRVQTLEPPPLPPEPDGYELCDLDEATDEVTCVQGLFI